MIINKEFVRFYLLKKILFYILKYVSHAYLDINKFMPKKSQALIDIENNSFHAYFLVDI